MEAVFTFKNTHDAIHGERILLDEGVAVKVMALPSSLGAGCGLCLRLPAEALDASRALLEQSGIVPEGTYFRHTENGKITYSEVE